MRKISKLGLRKQYDSNSELVLALIMTPALSFVPQSKLEIGFDLKNEEIGSVTSKLDISQSDPTLRQALGLFPKRTLKGI